MVQAEAEEIKNFLGTDYKYGFNDPEKFSFKSGRFQS